MTKQLHSRSFSELWTAFLSLHGDYADGVITAIKLKSSELKLTNEAARRDAELEALRAAIQWQPIETAPKDGSDVLVWCDTHKCIRQAHWHCGLWMRPTYEGSCTNVAATHWMPLPAAPEGAE